MINIITPLLEINKSACQGYRDTLISSIGAKLFVYLNQPPCRAPQTSVSELYGVKG